MMNKTVMPTPPPIEEITRRIRAHRDDLSRLGALHLDVFGSCSRGEQEPGSDIDLIVHLEQGFGYFDLGEMKGILEDEFGVEVNPVMESGVKSDSHVRTGAVRVF